LGLVLRSKIAIAPMAKATKRCLKDFSFKLILLIGLSSIILYHDIVILSMGFYIFQELFSYISSASPADAYKGFMKRIKVYFYTF
jgi:hypothetical protein